MEVLIGIAVLILIFLLMKGKNSKNEKQKANAKRPAIAKNTMEPIRKQHQIYEQNTSVQGIQHTKDDCNRFIEDGNLRLRLEKEPNNRVDKNAIKVIGIGAKSEYFLGYVPQNIALKISTTECFDYIYPRIIKVYRSEQGYIDITFQIVGKKDKKSQYDDFEKNLPINKEQARYLKFWKINYVKEMKTSEANNIIKEHRKKAEIDEPNKWAEWEKKEYLQNLYEIFSDKDERDQFDINKPTKEQLENALNSLLREEKNIEELEEDNEIFVDKLIELYPNIQR